MEKTMKHPMKTILLTVLLAALSLATSHNAHAVVADRFECRVQLTETDTGESTYQNLGFDRAPAQAFGSRRPLAERRGLGLTIPARVQSDVRKKSRVFQLGSRKFKIFMSIFWHSGNHGLGVGSRAKINTP